MTQISTLPPDIQMLIICQFGVILALIGHGLSWHYRHDRLAIELNKLKGHQ